MELPKLEEIADEKEESIPKYTESSHPINSKRKPNLWERMFRKNKLKKPQMVAVVYLRNNGRAEPIEVESKKGFFTIYGKTYNEDRDCIYLLGKDKTPLAIIPEWSLIPYGTKKWHDKEMLEKFAELQDHVLRGIRHAELVRMGNESGSKLNMKAIIGLIIAAIIGYAILSAYI